MTQKNTRTESDLLGSVEVPENVLYGVQTMRGLENFPISKFHLSDYPRFIHGLAVVKLGAAMANHELGLLSDEVYEAIAQACREIMAGQHHEHFPVDMIQGGAGTTTNMNANEVIANRALELMGDDSYGNNVSILIEYLRHSDFLTDNAFDHFEIFLLFQLLVDI